MEIFVSWSGKRSHSLGVALRSWLPKGMNAVRPWISSHDIDKGARWNTEIATRLEASSFGIICLTPENLHSDWLLFEAGAIGKRFETSLVCPLLLDLDPSDIEFPLAQFQATRVNKTELRNLVITINSLLGEHALSQSHLDEAFEVWWPRLEDELQKLPGEHVERVIRTDRAILEEVLALTRAQSGYINLTHNGELHEDLVLHIRLLLRELTDELDIAVPGYEFSWIKNVIYLHLDGYEVSTRVAFLLPFSKSKARERLREGLLRFERISDMRCVEDSPEHEPL